jgi:hypothetical protein
MNAQSIKEAVDVRPFRQFVLRTGDGREYLVKSPEMIYFIPGGRTIIVTQGEDEFDMLDSILISSLHYKRGTSGKSKRGRRNGH